MQLALLKVIFLGLALNRGSQTSPKNSERFMVKEWQQRGNSLSELARSHVLPKLEKALALSC